MTQRNTIRKDFGVSYIPLNARKKRGERERIERERDRERELVREETFQTLCN